jgi:cytosine/adenosine deaminase-related metal-dependent hydrolase
VYKNALLTYLHLCTHLAETREEAQFLRDGTGPFRELLEAWNLWDGSFEPPGCSPVSYMRRLGVLRPDIKRFFPPILAHANYVDDSDLAILAECRASVAYCPRTHAFFGHEPHRYRDMEAQGINVCLGTDSLASNQSLSILDELRYLRSVDRKTSDDVLLQMATTNGAKALGRPDLLGSLERGRWADLIAVPLEHPGTSKPLEDLLRGRKNPSHVFVQGKLAWQAGS